MSNYSSKKLELLALKWAVTDKLHDYLHGAHFFVFTDNNPLTHVMTQKKLPALEQRWVNALASFDFKIRYRSGKSNTNADGLSRRPHVTEEAETISSCMASTLHCTAVPTPFRRAILNDVQHADTAQPMTIDVACTLPRYRNEAIATMQLDDTGINAVLKFHASQRSPTHRERQDMSQASHGCKNYATLQPAADSRTAQPEMRLGCVDCSSSSRSSFRAKCSEVYMMTLATRVVRGQRP